MKNLILIFSLLIFFSGPSYAMSPSEDDQDKTEFTRKFATLEPNFVFFASKEKKIQQDQKYYYCEHWTKPGTEVIYRRSGFPLPWSERFKNLWKGLMGSDR